MTRLKSFDYLYWFSMGSVVASVVMIAWVIWTEANGG
jgi:hypothetical protein